MKTLRRFLRLIAPYWFTRHNRTAWALLAADTACTLILILIGVWIVRWDKRFYDALHDMNGSILPALVVEYLGYLASSSPGRTQANGCASASSSTGASR